MQLEVGHPQYSGELFLTQNWGTRKELFTMSTLRTNGEMQLLGGSFPVYWGIFLTQNWGT